MALSVRELRTAVREWACWWSIDNLCKQYPGVTNYIVAWMLQTYSMTPSLIYKVSFSLHNIIQISVCQNLAVQAVPNITLEQNI